MAQGIFENYPNTKYRDPSMRVVSGSEAGLLNHSLVQCGYSFASAIDQYMHPSPPSPSYCELFYVCCMCLHFQTARVLEWMLFQDVVQQTIMSTQNYSLYQCLPFAAVAAHMHLAAPGNPRIHYPHQQFEVCAFWLASCVQSQCMLMCHQCVYVHYSYLCHFVMISLKEVPSSFTAW